MTNDKPKANMMDMYPELDKRIMDTLQDILNWTDFRTDLYALLQGHPTDLDTIAMRNNVEIRYYDIALYVFTPLRQVSIALTQPMGMTPLDDGSIRVNLINAIHTQEVTLWIWKEAKAHKDKLELLEKTITDARAFWRKQLPTNKNTDATLYRMYPHIFGHVTDF